MRQYDLHDSIRVVRTISPQNVGTTGTGQTGKVVDRAGAQAVELVVGYGSVTATNATITPTLMEGDATGAMTSVADSNMIPNASGESLAAIAAAAVRTSGVSKNVTHRIGYIGTKRYVSANVKSTVTAGTPVHAEFILGSPNNAPTVS
jgi:hypothetical protein